MTDTARTSREVADAYLVAPPIVKAALNAILDHEESVDDMGYDIAYYQQDLPAAVAKAIKPWEHM